MDKLIKTLGDFNIVQVQEILQRKAYLYQNELQTMRDKIELKFGNRIIESSLGDDIEDMVKS